MKDIKDIVEQRIHDGSLRLALERRRSSNSNINAVVDRALRGKPLHGLKLVETGAMRQVLSNGWTDEEIDYLINRGTESPFLKSLRKELAKEGIEL